MGATVVAVMFFRRHELLGILSRGVAGAVGVGAGAGERAAPRSGTRPAIPAVVEPALEDLAGRRWRSGPGPRATRRGSVRRHAVVGASSARDGPSEAGWGYLDIAGVAGELARLERPHDRVSVADFSRAASMRYVPRRIVSRSSSSKSPSVSGVQRRVDRDHVALGHHVLGALVVGEAELAPPPR